MLRRSATKPRAGLADGSQSSELGVPAHRAAGGIMRASSNGALAAVEQRYCTRWPDSSACSAMRAPVVPREKFVMQRTASMGTSVPPLVTMMDSVPEFIGKMGSGGSHLDPEGRGDRFFFHSDSTRSARDQELGEPADSLGRLFGQHAARVDIGNQVSLRVVMASSRPECHVG